MFMVVNKDKIVSYIVSFSTVAILFCLSFFMTKNNERILETSTNVVTNNILTNQLEVNIIEVNGTKTEKKYVDNVYK